MLHLVVRMLRCVVSDESSAAAREHAESAEISRAATGTCKRSRVARTSCDVACEGVSNLSL